MQDSRTALYQASKNGRVAVVQLLLEEHADHTIGNQVCIGHSIPLCDFPVEYCTPRAGGYRYTCYTSLACEEAHAYCRGRLVGCAHLIEPFRLPKNAALLHHSISHFTAGILTQYWDMVKMLYMQSINGSRNSNRRDAYTVYLICLCS